MNINTKELFIIMPPANTLNKEGPLKKVKVLRLSQMYFIENPTFYIKIEKSKNDDILLVKTTFIFMIVRFKQNDKSCKVIKCSMM